MASVCMDPKFIHKFRVGFNMQGSFFFGMCESGQIYNLNKEYTDRDLSFDRGLRVAVHNGHHDLVMFLLGGGIKKRVIRKNDVLRAFTQAVVSENTKILHSIMKIGGDLAITHEDVLSVSGLVKSVGTKEQIALHSEIEKSMRPMTSDVSKTELDKIKDDFEKALAVFEEANLAFQKACVILQKARDSFESFVSSATPKAAASASSSD